MRKLLPAMGLALFCVLPAQAAVISTTTHGDENLNGVAQPILADDLLQGLIPFEAVGDLGWHPVNTNPADQLQAFTDGIGDTGTGLTGLLNDACPGGNCAPGYDQPVKLVVYDLGGPKNIGELRIFSGNFGGKDGRVFSTAVVRYSTDGGASFQDLGYFQSDPSGTANFNRTWGSTLVQILDDRGEALAGSVTHLQFNFYAVHRNNDTMHDPFNGDNPFTPGVDDDGLLPPFTSPLIWEIDVLLFEGEVCNNAADDDGDGLADCADPDCADSVLCPCNDPFADYDNDGDVDQSDFGLLQVCFTGSIAGLPAFPDLDCGCFERDGDEMINESDLAAFAGCLSGPDVPADKTCDDR